MKSSVLGIEDKLILMSDEDLTERAHCDSKQLKTLNIVICLISYQLKWVFILISSFFWNYPHLLTFPPQTATLRPYLNAVRATLQAALCLENFSSQVVERHNKPEVEVRWVCYCTFERHSGEMKTEQCVKSEINQNYYACFCPFSGVVKSCSSNLWSSAVTTRRRFWSRDQSTLSGLASLSSRSARLKTHGNIATAD